MNVNIKNDSFSSYNPYVNFVFFAGSVFAGMFIAHPAYILSSVIFSAVYLYMIKGKAALKSMMWYFIVFVMVSIINPLFNTSGESVLFMMFGRKYTLEALLYGMSTAGTLVSVLLWFSSYNMIMTEDKFLYIFGKMIPSVSLMLTMILRFVPGYNKKLTQISTARKCIGKGSSDETFGEKTENALTILGTLTSWALEGGITTADSMRCRGFGCGERTSFLQYSFKLWDKLLMGFIVLSLGTVMYLSVCGYVYSDYMNMMISPITGGVGLCGIICYSMFLSVPTVINIKDKIIWHILKSKI